MIPNMKSMNIFFLYQLVMNLVTTIGYMKEEDYEWKIMDVGFWTKFGKYKGLPVILAQINF